MRRAVVICPGRGTYTKSELGTLAALHPDKADLFAQFDAIREQAGQEKLAELDGATRYSVARHTRGDNASALIFAASYADYQSLKDIEVVAVTGNSMGWYTALTCGGAVGATDGFQLANTMGSLMQESLIGGQLVYPVMDSNWQPDPSGKQKLLRLVNQIDAQPNHILVLSIDLGGMLVLAGNTEGLAAFEAVVPPVDRFPMRLANHAGFHSQLQAPVAAKGQAALADLTFDQPKVPLIDGRGAIWWPGAASANAMRAYTLGHQVTESYDFTHAIAVAAREFAPDIFIIAGPGTTLGGAVAQSLIHANWLGMSNKTEFQKLQSDAPFLVSMGREDQRGLVT